MHSNTILVNEDKSLIGTQIRPIYKGENRGDEIQFLIDPNVFDGMDEYLILALFVILPYPDEEHHTPTTNKMRYMEIDEELYKGKYRTVLPINNILTKADGNVYMWLMFFNTEDQEHIKLLKTEVYTVHILPVMADASSILDDDTSYDVLEQLQQEITNLQETRMDKHFEYNEETQTIQFFSNGEPYGNPVPLDTNVSWRGWE